MRNFRFELMIYPRIPELPQIIPANKFIEKFKTNETEWKVDLNDSSFDLEIGDVIYISPDWNFGRVDWLIPQLKAASERLKMNTYALVRSAVLEGREIPYLSFKPDGEDIFISLFTFKDLEIESIFPAGPFSEKSAKLYSHFNKCSKSLFDNIPEEFLKDPGFTEYFREIQVSKSLMIDKLEIAIKDAEELCSLL